MDNLLFIMVKKTHYSFNKLERNCVEKKKIVLKHDMFFGGVLSKGFTALSNKITCQTVSSVGDLPALIIFPYFISSLESTLTVFFGFLLTVNQSYCPGGMRSFQESIHTSTQWQQPSPESQGQSVQQCSRSKIPLLC